MKKTREFKGMPVLTLQEGEQLGQVRDLILDPATRQVVALVLDRRAAKGEDQVIATANVRNVGTAAITVEDRSSLVALNRIPRFQELAQSRKPIQGKMVISETGARLGQVDDLEVDPLTFRIVSLVLKGGMFGRGRVISADLVRTIGNDAIVVRDEAMVEETPPAPPPAAPIWPAEAPTPPPPPALEKSAAPPEPVAEPVLPSMEAAPLPPGDAGTPPADTGAEPAEEAAAEEPAENSWQRWVRRLKKNG